MKMFPIQMERDADPHPVRVPWNVAELAYSVYAGRYGTSQSLERLAQRGGFAPSEMDNFLPDWRKRCDLTLGLAEENGRLVSDVGFFKRGLESIRDRAAVFAREGGGHDPRKSAVEACSWIAQEATGLLEPAAAITDPSRCTRDGVPIVGGLRVRLTTPGHECETNVGYPAFNGPWVRVKMHKGHKLVNPLEVESKHVRDKTAQGPPQDDRPSQEAGQGAKVGD